MKVHSFIVIHIIIDSSLKPKARLFPPPPQDHQVDQVEIYKKGPIHSMNTTNLLTHHYFSKTTKINDLGM